MDTWTFEGCTLINGGDDYAVALGERGLAGGDDAGEGES